MRAKSLALCLLTAIVLIYVVLPATTKAMDVTLPENDGPSTERSHSSWSSTSDDAISVGSNEPLEVSLLQTKKQRVGLYRSQLPALRPAAPTEARLDYIPRRQDLLGIEWGPYPLHPSEFQLQFYPLDEPALSHLYQVDSSEPVPFESPSTVVGSRYRWFPAVYRPDPKLLHRLRSKILSQLRETGWTGKQVHRHYPRFLEGMYLWPPLQDSTSGYQMPREILQNRVLSVPRNRLQRRIKRPTNLFTFVIDSSEGPRYILATTVLKNERLTPIALRDLDSRLWLFYERRQIAEPNRTKKMTAFLGAMFLPKDATQILVDSGAMTVFRHQ